MRSSMALRKWTIVIGHCHGNVGRHCCELWMGLYTRSSLYLCLGMLAELEWMLSSSSNWIWKGWSRLVGHQLLLNMAFCAYRMFCRKLMVVRTDGIERSNMKTNERWPSLCLLFSVHKPTFAASILYISFSLLVFCT
ncbi:unnamed protein product [Linum tenue]|uniref:Uncharacterized protein n=1 Tax=Linum tenue TaxID=586396 RepID=A0AAV0K9S4_9ROSI|nr:unnamed protein product [Linum tenue]